MLPVFDIAIDKLRIQAARKDADRIANDLQNGGWNVGENTDWLFIRELNVSSPKNGLRLNASREIKYESERAVYGGSGQAASANAVRFSSFPDVLAFLLADITWGRRKWFWQKWLNFFSLSKSEAITRLLWENMTGFAAVVERLSEIDALPEVWRNLSVPHAEILLARVAELQHLPPKRLLSPEYEMELLTNHDGNLAPVLKHRNKHYDRWRKIFPPSSKPDAKFYLAAMVAGIAYVPQAVARRPESVIAAFHRLILDEVKQADANRVTERRNMASSENDYPFNTGVNKFTVNKKNVEKLMDEASASEIAGIKANKEKQQNHGNKNSSIVVNENKTEPDQTVIANIAVEASVPHWLDRGYSNNSFDPADGSEEKVSFEKLSADVAAEETQFYTHLGGVFYLINAINHPESYALLRETKAWQELATGWTLIYCLATKLTDRFDQPLMLFFADICGFASVSQLDSVKHPELVEILLPCLQQRYEKHLQWNADLLTLPARVTTTYSDINVVCDMSAIRLPVRLSGLDVNPGWIPWLGRVIRFHYRDEPGLKVSNEHE